jgi:ATPase subunit of ABC transporter with duplicated ATPase domains
MLATVNLGMQFGADILFENVNAKFFGGNRYGLIGANGCGKSTLMKILGGEVESTAGDLALERGLRLGKLKQDQFAYEDQRVLDVVMQGHVEMWQAMTDRDAIYANADATDEDYTRAAELEGVFAQYDGYTAEARAGELLIGVGIPIDKHQGPMREVPPGLKVRVLLAQALFSKPDVLLLDEPTNNLDINSIRWLEGVLNDYASTMVIISHDRHFLNHVCTHVADMDYGTLKTYPGNYDDFMLASTQAREQQSAANSKAKEKIADLQEFVRRFSANKSKAKQATSRLRQIEKIKVEDMKPSSRLAPYIRFEENKKLYRLAASVQSISFRYAGMEADIVRKFSLNVEAGERIAIVGGNGLGKTTLLRSMFGTHEMGMLAGQSQGLTVTAGEVKWAENARIGYMAQDPNDDFAVDMNLFDWMSQWKTAVPGENYDDQLIRATLGRLLFSGDELKKSVKVLSGGERGRMLYGKLMLMKPNVLLLDEPTNHMDMETIEALQIGLEKYPGTLMFVSHDREFVGGLATRVVELTETGPIDFKGSYDEYLTSRGWE